MEEKSPFVDDVQDRWPDLQAARGLGIRTYASAPISLADGSVYGTLCAAGNQVRPVLPRVRQLFRFFASLIGKYVERERLLLQLKRANVELESHALTDALTRLPNRRATMGELQRLFAQARRLRQAVLLAFIDLDGFKFINDTHGHDVGDTFLVEIGRRLSGGLRAGDWLGRLGGDEFVVVGLGPSVEVDGAHAIAAMRGRLGPLTQGRFELPGITLDYPGTSLGIVSVDPAVTTEEEALRVADAAMYLDKRERRRIQEARRA
jgi:diguanylate cyclase